MNEFTKVFPYLNGVFSSAEDFAEKLANMLFNLSETIELKHGATWISETALRYFMMVQESIDKGELTEEDGLLMSEPLVVAEYVMIVDSTSK